MCIVLWQMARYFWELHSRTNNYNVVNSTNLAFVWGLRVCLTYASMAKLVYWGMDCYCCVYYVAKPVGASCAYRWIV